MASTSRQAAAPAAPEDQEAPKLQPWENRYRKMVESSKPDERIKGLQLASDALKQADLEALPAGAGQHILWAATGIIQEIKVTIEGEGGKALTDEVANLALEAAMFICTASDHDKVGKARLEELAAPLLFVVCYAANVKPPARHKRSQQAVAQVAGLLLTIPACVQQKEFKGAVNKLLSRHSSHVAQGIACSIIAHTISQMQPTKGMQASVVVAEASWMVRLLFEFFGTFRAVSATADVQQVQQSMLPADIQPLARGLEGFFAALGVKLQDNGSLPSGAVKEILEKFEAKVDEPEPAAPVYKKKGSIHDAVQDVKKVVESTSAAQAAARVDLRPAAAGTGTTQVTTGDDELDKALALASRNTDMLGTIRATARAGKDKLAVRLWSMAGAAAAGIGADIVPARGPLFDLRLAMFSNELSKYIDFTSEMMSGANKAGVDAAAQAMYGAAALLAVLKLGLNCSVTFTLYANWLFGVVKIFAICVHRSSDRLAAMPATLKGRWDPEKEAEELCPARLAGTGDVAEKAASEVGAQSLQLILKDCVASGILELAGVAEMADAEPQFNQLLNLPLEAHCKLVGALAAFFRAADAAKESHCTVDSQFKAPSLIQAAGKVVSELLPVHSVRALERNLLHLETESKKSLDAEALDFFAGENSIVLEMELLCDVWQGGALASDPVAVHRCRGHLAAIRGNLYQNAVATEMLKQVEEKLAVIRADMQDMVQAPAFDIAQAARNFEKGGGSAAVAGMEAACKAAVTADPATAASAFKQLMASVSKLTSMAQQWAHTGARFVHRS